METGCQSEKYIIDFLPDQDIVFSKVYGEGHTAPYIAWDNILNWAKENPNKQVYYGFNNYNINRANLKKYYVSMVCIDELSGPLPKGLSSNKLPGGKFISTSCNCKTLPDTWEQLLAYIESRGLKINPKLRFREQWFISGSEQENPDIKIFCPIK